MSVSSITLHSAFNRLTGHLAGKSLICSFRSLSGGALRPGKYKISAPMHNSFYGTFALLTVTGPAVHPRAMGKDWVTKDWVSKDWVTRDWVDKSLVSPFSHVSRPGVFVIVGEPFAGRNGLVITHGFGELMAALQESGGATVTVS